MFIIQWYERTGGVRDALVLTNSSESILQVKTHQNRKNYSEWHAFGFILLDVRWPMHPHWAFSSARSLQQICKQQLQKPPLTTLLTTHHNHHASQPASNNSHRNDQHSVCICLYDPRKWTLLTFKMCLPSPRIFDTCLCYKVLSFGMGASPVQILKR